MASTLADLSQTSQLVETRAGDFGNVLLQWKFTIKPHYQNPHHNGRLDSFHPNRQREILAGKFRQIIPRPDQHFFSFFRHLAGIGEQHISSWRRQTDAGEDLKRQQKKHLRAAACHHQMTWNAHHSAGWRQYCLRCKPFLYPRNRIWWHYFACYKFFPKVAQNSPIIPQVFWLFSSFIFQIFQGFPGLWPSCIQKMGLSIAAEPTPTDAMWKSEAEKILNQQNDHQQNHVKRPDKRRAMTAE